METSSKRRLIFGRPLAAAAVVAALASASCSSCKKKEAGPALPPPNPCAGEVAARVELRKQDGTLVAALRSPATVAGTTAPGAPAAADVLCDGEGKLVGRLEERAAPRGFSLRDDKGAVIASASSADKPGGDGALVFGGKTYRLLDQGALLRVLDPQGVPLGQVGQLPERGVAFNPGGKPVATAEVEKAGEGKRVIHAPDGSVTHFMIGVGDDRAAAALGLEGLGLPERFVLSRWLDASVK